MTEKANGRVQERAMTGGRVIINNAAGLKEYLKQLQPCGSLLLLSARLSSAQEAIVTSAVSGGDYLVMPINVNETDESESLALLHDIPRKPRLVLGVGGQITVLLAKLAASSAECPLVLLPTSPCETFATRVTLFDGKQYGSYALQSAQITIIDVAFMRSENYCSSLYLRLMTAYVSLTDVLSHTAISQKVLRLRSAVKGCLLSGNLKGGAALWLETEALLYEEKHVPACISAALGLKDITSIDFSTRLATVVLMVLALQCMGNKVNNVDAATIELPPDIADMAFCAKNDVAQALINSRLLLSGAALEKQYYLSREYRSMVQAERLTNDIIVKIGGTYRRFLSDKGYSLSRIGVDDKLIKAALLLFSVANDGLFSTAYLQF